MSRLIRSSFILAFVWTMFGFTSTKNNTIKPEYSEAKLSIKELNKLKELNRALTLGVVGKNRYVFKYLDNKNIKYIRVSTPEELQNCRGLLVLSNRLSGKTYRALQLHVKAGGKVWFTIPPRIHDTLGVRLKGGRLWECDSYKILNSQNADRTSKPIKLNKDETIKFYRMSICSENCNVLAEASIKKLGKETYYPWLTQNNYGRGVAISGGHGLFKFITSSKTKRVPLTSLVDRTLNKIIDNYTFSPIVYKKYMKDELYYKRIWKGLKKNSVKRKGINYTLLDFRNSELKLSKEELLETMQRYQAEVFWFWKFSVLNKKENVKKIEWLRSKGYKFMLSATKPPLADRLPGTKGYIAYMKKVAQIAKMVDIIGPDELFLSPAVVKTPGGHATRINKSFLKAFQKEYNYSWEDTVWAFKNHKADDDRARNTWKFCSKVQNEMLKEFVKTVKKANPKAKTWISYINRNWNKYVTSIDSAISEFDIILDCQTYWFGRYSKDPLNSPKITNAFGQGKLKNYEYPNKFLWLGCDPGYSCISDSLTKKNNWWLKYYNCTPEEVVPYLASLYAASEGVFVQNPISGSSSDYKFADMIRLVSNLVPTVKDYVKGDALFYYDPKAAWEIMRRGNSWFDRREGYRIALGLLQQFADFDVTDSPEGAKNIVTAGYLLPSKLDYKKQNILLLYNPEYNEKGERVGKGILQHKLSIDGFSTLPTSSENASNLKLQLNGNKYLFAGKQIVNSKYPFRKIGSSNITIASLNKHGNVLVDSLWPSYVKQNLAQEVYLEDLKHFGLNKRNCPQLNGKKNNVAVAFRKERTAQIDFGKDATWTKVKILMFNGKEGIFHNEIVDYKRGMKVLIPKLSVLVATGLK